MKLVRIAIRCMLCLAVLLCVLCCSAAAEDSITLYGKEFPLDTETIDLRKVPVNDNGAAVMEALPLFKNCKVLDMDSCGVDNEHMAIIRDSFPDIKVIWRVWFSTLDYSARTDVKTILASLTGYGDNVGFTDEASCLPLTYCTEVTALDVGHNSNMRTLSFIKYMPNLEIFITYENYLRDIDDLKYAKHLRYLELWGNSMKNIDALAELYELTDVMLCGCGFLDDISPIIPADKVPNLRRLWISGIPEEQVEQFRANHPNCEVNDWECSSNSLWRFIDPGMYNEESNRTPAYQRLVEIFHYPAPDCTAYNFSRNDPYYTTPAGEAVTGERVSWFYEVHHYDPYGIYGDSDS